MMTSFLVHSLKLDFFTSICFDNTAETTWTTSIDLISKFDFIQSYKTKNKISLETNYRPKFLKESSTSGYV